jgi:hypothetical protein
MGIHEDLAYAGLIFCFIKNVSVSRLKKNPIVFSKLGDIGPREKVQVPTLVNSGCATSVCGWRKSLLLGPGDWLFVDSK